MTVTNNYGWADGGFDPDKNQPAWRQYLVDACEFAIDCRHQGNEGFKLATLAELWLAKLHEYPHGFVPASAADMLDLADVVQDFTDYEETNGRENRLVSRFADVVLRGVVPHG